MPLSPLATFHHQQVCQWNEEEEGQAHRHRHTQAHTDTHRHTQTHTDTHLACCAGFFCSNTNKQTDRQTKKTRQVRIHLKKGRKEGGEQQPPHLAHGCFSFAKLAVEENNGMALRMFSKAPTRRRKRKRKERRRKQFPHSLPSHTTQTDLVNNERGGSRQLCCCMVR